MKNKLMIAFAAFGLCIASAKSYRLTLYQPSNIGGQELKAGEYKLNVEGDKATITNGRQSSETKVKVENSEKKFASTSVRYNGEGAAKKVEEIRVGGTNMKLVLND